MDRVDQRRWQVFLVGVGPLRLSNELLEVFAGKKQVVMNRLLINLPEPLLRTFSLLACFFCALNEILNEVNVIVGLGFPDFLLLFRVDGRLETLFCEIVSTASLDFDLFLLLLLFRVLWLVLGFAFSLDVFLRAGFWFYRRSFGFYNAGLLKFLCLFF